MAEIGLMLRAGALLLGDGGQPIADTRLARRVLAYASGFDAWVASAPKIPASAAARWPAKAIWPCVWGFPRARPSPKPWRSPATPASLR
jgi:hypothetical protein